MLKGKIEELMVRLSPREQLLIALSIAACIVVGIYLGVKALLVDIQANERLATLRLTQIEQIQALVKRFQSLDQRLERLRTSFAESQLTFEQVTQQIDTIVKQSVGNDTYDLKRGRSPTAVGTEYQKQEFTLRVTSLTLAQVVDLLYRLEHGESPLFLGKVDLLVSPRDSSFSATLEIFSVLRAQ